MGGVARDGEDSGKHASSVLGGGSRLIEPLAKQGGECRGEWLGKGGGFGVNGGALFTW